MGELFASGRIVDLIIGLVFLEAVGLAAYRRATGRGIATGDLLPNLLSGGCLLLALRGALADAPWGVVAACLAAAFGAHLVDLGRRWRA